MSDFDDYEMHFTTMNTRGLEFLLVSNCHLCRVRILKNVKFTAVYDIDFVTGGHPFKVRQYNPNFC